jgi:stage V sporulation protein B
MSITFILFPLLARAKAEGDRNAMRRYTTSGVRLALVLTVLMTGTISGVAPLLLRTVFHDDDIFWQQGALALRILSLGMGAFGILGILCAALNSLGRATTAFYVTLFAVLLVATSCVLVVPRTALGAPMLVASATATSISLAIAAVVAGVLVRHAAGAVVSPITLLRTGLSLVVAIGVGRHLPWAGRVGTLAEAATVALAGAVVLVVLGEVGSADLEGLKKVMRRAKR